MRKSGLLTFLCACVPGCGQMYQGYMKRGTSLLFWFFAIIAVATLFHLEILLVFLFLIWAYSFFDSFNLRNLSPEQRAGFADGFIPSAQWMDYTGFDKLMKRANFGTIVGWGLVIFGGVILFQSLWREFYSLMWDYNPWLGSIMSMVPRLVIAALIIVLGVRMLRGRKAPTRPADDELTPFRGEGESHE